MSCDLMAYGNISVFIFQAGSGNEFEFGIRSTLVFDSNDSEAEGYLYMPGGGLAHNETTL